MALILKDESKFIIEIYNKYRPLIWLETSVPGLLRIICVFHSTPVSALSQILGTQTVRCKRSMTYVLRKYISSVIESFLSGLNNIALETPFSVRSAKIFLRFLAQLSVASELAIVLSGGYK